MSWGRVLSSCVATVTVAGCAVLAVNMSRAQQDEPGARSTQRAAHSRTVIPATKTFGHTPVALTPSSPSRPTTAVSTPVSAASAPQTASTATAAVPTVVALAPAARVAAPSAARSTAAPAARAAVTSTPAPKRTAVAAAPARGVALPVHYKTGTATRVITVTARSTGSTVATVQAWSKLAAGGWKKVGTAIGAHIGADGMSTRPSESRSATPMGTFTLTQAFGRNSDPGTALPYFRTTPSDYWISDSGSRYNTHQRCGTCGYNDGVNERLYYVTPQYDYAVVIDYNTRNAPGGVKQGRGSAFFLHVTDGNATAGCVAIPKARLVSLMKWLTPSTHPRILIGTG